MRDLPVDPRITVTSRQLESMIRLAEAHAKMRLSDEETANDVSEAVRLIKSVLRTEDPASTAEGASSSSALDVRRQAKG